MIDKIKENWEKILLILKEEHEVSDVSYRTWLQPLTPYSFKGNTVTIIVPEQTFLAYVKKKYGLLLKVTISEFLDQDCDVDFKVKDQIEEEKQAQAPSLIQKNKAVVSPDVIQSANLNPKYTFDTFVVGSNNNLAHAAALAVAESPGEIYNPLFIYGGVGLGKTHLMHAIAHFILKNNPSAKILYVSSETFTNELIDAIRNKNNITTTEFREKYRNNDVLLIDDIQFIIGKESTQEEFFHTFNTLYESKKQIIISSDKPPKEIETLEERLRSRFEWGLTVDIQSPDYETRMAILRKKEEMEGYNIDNEVIKYIATNIKSNIRELEGALTKIVALSRLNKCDITLGLAEEALKDIISPNAQREVTPNLIIQVVSDHFGITPLDISSQKRTKEIVYPRQIVMYLCRNMTETPLQSIGRILGGRDHTTIIHGSEKIAADMNKDENLKNTIEILKKNNKKFQFPVEWGVDIQTEHERYLTEVVFKKPVFVTDYPKEIKSFYMKQNPDGKTVAAADMLVPGIGELIGGSQREEDYDKLVARMDELGLDKSSYDWYLNLRKFGGVEHAGYGLGFERMIMYLTGIQNIRDVLPFPRTAYGF